jgi:hypothetical protein
MIQKTAYMAMQIPRTVVGKISAQRVLGNRPKPHDEETEIEYEADCGECSICTVVLPHPKCLP